MLAIENRFNQLLQYVAESLDISENRFLDAEKRYQSILNWLEREDSRVRKYNPDTYLQGSFMLGTVIKPITDAEEYDIDLVCELKLTKNQITQKRLKELVGFEIKGYVQAKNMKSQAEEGKRCWILNYADGAQFHMDILPSIPDGEGFRRFLETRGAANNWAGKSIAITDNTLPNYDLFDTSWLRSNPKGYAAWFNERMKIQFNEQRAYLAKSLNTNVEKIPNYKVKTTLQRAVQILKRHRDIMFAKDRDNKPISIIITTLAAHAYNNEADLLEALINIVEGMPRFIQTKNGFTWVANPVNPFENFADKWLKHPQREKSFRRWLRQIQSDLENALRMGDIRAIGESLEPRLGERTISEAMKHFSQGNSSKKSLPALRTSRILSRFDVEHRQSPPWPVQPDYSVTVMGYLKSNGKMYQFKSDGPRLPKNNDLIFSAETNVARPFNVFWQVVNTGDEAKQVNQLRGEIFPSKTAGAGGLDQRESTRYTGSHWVECFIVKNGICVARSREFVVNIE